MPATDRFWHPPLNKLTINYLFLNEITFIEEVDCLEFLLHVCLLLVCHIVKRCAVLSEIETDQLHDALAAYDIAAVVADNIDYLLCKVLQLACLLDITCLPGIKKPVRQRPL